MGSDKGKQDETYSKTVRQERENKWENNRTLSVKIVKMRSILISNQPLKLRRLKPSRQSTVEGEKLQKVLARAGQGSRREIEAMIAENRVSVDGKMATLGDRIDVHSGVKGAY